MFSLHLTVLRSFSTVIPLSRICSHPHENVASIEAGVKGDFISINFSTSFRKNLNLPNYSLQRYSKDKISLKANSGTVNVYAKAKVWIWTVFSAEFEVIKGFQIAEITW